MSYTAPKTHGEAKPPTPEYRAWQMMKYRCDTPTCHAWLRYGGRGIVYDRRWASYVEFLKDMGRRPSSDHSLERRDNSLGYNKSNCYWATAAQQQRNTRHTKLTQQAVGQIRIRYAAGGILQKELAKEFGVTQYHISAVIRGERWA